MPMDKVVVHWLDAKVEPGWSTREELQSGLADVYSVGYFLDNEAGVTRIFGGWSGNDLLTVQSIPSDSIISIYKLEEGERYDS